MQELFIMALIICFTKGRESSNSIIDNLLATELRSLEQCKLSNYDKWEVILNDPLCLVAVQRLPTTALHNIIGHDTVLELLYIAKDQGSVRSLSARLVIGWFYKQRSVIGSYFL